MLCRWIIQTTHIFFRDMLADPYTIANILKLEIFTIVITYQHFKTHIALPCTLLQQTIGFI
jgi:hypothetical protein